MNIFQYSIARKLFFLASLIFVIVFFVHSTHGRVWSVSGNLNHEKYGDLFHSMDAASDVREGRSPYRIMSPEHPHAKEWISVYGYPLTQAWLLIPLTFFSPGVIKLVWVFACTAFIGGTCWLLVKTSRFGQLGPPCGWGFSLVVLILLLCMEPVQNNFIYLQVNFLMLLGLAGALFFYLSGRKAYSGIALGFAISVKMLPLLLVFYLLLRRDWKTLSYTFLSALFFCFLPVLWMGGEVFRSYAFFIEKVMLPRMDTIYDTSLFMTLHRTVSWFFPELLHNHAVKKICNILTLALICLADLRGRGRKNRDIWAFCLYLNGILLLMPQSQMHYLVLVIPVFYFCILCCIKAGKITDWVILAVSYIVFWPMLWVEDTPAHFVSLVLLSVQCYRFMMREEKLVEITVASEGS